MEKNGRCGRKVREVLNESGKSKIMKYLAKNEKERELQRGDLRSLCEKGCEPEFTREIFMGNCGNMCGN